MLNVGVEEVAGTEHSMGFSLSKNFPNPFSGKTMISYQVPDGSNVPVVLKVYDVSGKVIRTLVEGEYGSGLYSVYWDGRNETGRGVAPGIYFARLIAGNYVMTRKMLFLH